MKTILYLLLISPILAGLAVAEPMPGDLIFHTSRSSQSRALQLAMNSPFSHMGIIFFKNKEPYVFEASKTVRYTPLQAWIQRGVGGKYRIKRLKNQKLLNPSSVRKLMEVAEKYSGKPYDLYFEWSDKRIYCSELVWKIYFNALGIRIGEIQTFKDFDLSHPEVQVKLKERFGSSIPFSEKVISPDSMFKSVVLTEPN